MDDSGEEEETADIAQVEAIRNLAVTQGLTTAKMTKKNQDEKIVEFTGLPLSEENLTQIIIKLTGYKK